MLRGPVPSDGRGARELPILIEPGDLLCFSGAHLHASRPNRTGTVRVSVDSRTVDLVDHRAGRGAKDVDGRAPRDGRDWFHRVSDGVAFAEALTKPVEASTKRAEACTKRLIAIALIAAAIWFWRESLQAREAATLAGRRICTANDVQFLRRDGGPREDGPRLERAGGAAQELPVRLQHGTGRTARRGSSSSRGGPSSTSSSTPRGPSTDFPPGAIR